MVNIWYNLIFSINWIKFLISLNLNRNRTFKLLFYTSFWNINFRFSILKRNVNFSSLDCLAIWIWWENIANSSSIFEWSIWNLNIYLIMFVCKCHKEISSWESIEVVLDIFFIHWMLPDFLFLSSFVNSLSEFVNVWVCIHVLP